MTVYGSLAPSGDCQDGLKQLVPGLLVGNYLSFALDGQLHELAKGLSGPSGLAVSLSVICAASCDDDLAWLQRRPQRCSRSVDVAPNLRRSAAFTRPY